MNVGAGRRGGEVSDGARRGDEAGRDVCDRGWFLKGFLQTPRGCLEGLGERGCVRTPRVPSADRASPPDSNELPDGWVPSKCGVM